MGQEAHFRMIGTFNAYNLLAVYGVARAMGEEKNECTGGAKWIAWSAG